MLLAFVFCPPTHTNGIFFQNLNTVFLLLFLSDVLCIFLFIESHTISKISFVEHSFLLPTTLIFCSQLLFYYFSCFWLNEIFYVMSMFYFFLSLHTISYKWLVIFLFRHKQLKLLSGQTLWNKLPLWHRSDLLSTFINQAWNHYTLLLLRLHSFSVKTNPSLYFVVIFRHIRESKKEKLLFVNISLNSVYGKA